MQGVLPAFLEHGYVVLEGALTPAELVMLRAQACCLTRRLAAAGREKILDRRTARAEQDGFVRVCGITELVERRGKVVRAGAERVALFLTGGRLFAPSLGSSPAL